MNQRAASRKVLLVWACFAVVVLGVRRAGGDPAVYEIGVDPGVGFNLISWDNFGAGGAATWQNAVQSLFDAGFRDVSISPVRFFSLTTGAISATSGDGPELSHIAAGIVRAKSLGMHVTVNPFIEPNGFSTWRANFNPAPNSAVWNTFWPQYQQYLVDVATMAQANGADAVTVGTELNGLDGRAANAPKWDAAIDAVDQVFTGEIGYAANWDQYRNGNLANSIWNHPAIDFLGIDAYFGYGQGVLPNAYTSNANTNTGVPGIGDGSFAGLMEWAWNGKLDGEILPYAQSLQAGTGLPVRFTEIGYQPYNLTSQNPQNPDGISVVDTAEQIAVFEGLIRALDGRKEEFRAFDTWTWGMPGTGGNLWDMGLGGEAQVNNVPLTQHLSNYANTAVPAFAADLNVDGAVDADDLAAWSAAFAAATNAGDVDGDGDSDGADFLQWQRELGAGISQAPAATAVPEPLACVLAATVVFAGKWRPPRSLRRRRR